MVDLKKNSYLLLCLVALVTTKFLILPLLSWQDERLAEIKLLKKKVNKAEKVISDLPLLEEQLIIINAQVDVLQNAVFDYADEGVFQLTLQKELEKTFDSHQVSILNLGWKAVSQVDDWGLLKYEVEINFNGSTRNFILLLKAIETNEKWMSINNFNYRFDPLKKGALGSVAGRLSINFYMKQQTI